MFIETSAKAGFNIKALFRKVASALPGLDSNDVERNTNCILLLSRFLFSISSLLFFPHRLFPLTTLPFFISPPPFFFLSEADPDVVIDPVLKPPATESQGGCMC
jgi:hypothetical protein